MKNIFFSLIFACILTFCAFAADFAYVYDDADLFSYEEEIKIEEIAADVYETGGLLCVIVTDYGIGDILNTLPAYAGSAVDMVMLSVDMSAREFEIYQYNAYEGESGFCISYAESEDILDSILPDMADGDYADAAIMFVKMAESAFSNLVDFIPGEYDGYEYVDYSYSDSFTVWEMFIMSLVFGCAAGGISVLCVWLSYKRKVHGTIYPLSQYSKLSLTGSKDNFITKNVVITHIPDPPSNSGGRSGGSGFGGGGARMGGRKF